MPKKSATATAPDVARPIMILSPAVWHERLREQLIEKAFDHDKADLVARRTLRRLVDAASLAPAPIQAQWLL